MKPQDLKQRKFWGVIVLAVVAFIVWFSIFSLPPKARLPVIGVVPKWTLINQSQQPFGSVDLDGKVYLANFIFSRCPSVCPKMLEDTAKLQKELKPLVGKVFITTFTVDPEFDTPAVLQKVAFDYKYHPQIWAFLTSESKESLFELYKNGFKVGVSDSRPIGDIFDIAHSEKIVLVDQKARIRGYYSYTDDSKKQLVRDVADLLEE